MLASLVAVVLGGNAYADQQAKAGSISRAAQGTPANASLLALGIGDKLKLSFFERLEVEDDKWVGRKKSGRPDQSFLLRTELSGEYTVQADGTILIPLLGAVAVAGKSSVDLDNELTKAFGETVGRPGFISIALIERSPIYIIGPVKQPGVYKYEPGLTVLHAIALAGGLGRAQEDSWSTSWSVVEAAREAGKLESLSRRLNRLLAEVSVLAAERDRAEPKPSQRLVELAGKREAEALIADQKERRAAIVKAREDRSKALALATEAARRAVDLARRRLDPIQDSVDRRKTRVGALEGLRGQGNLERTVLAMAQSELADVEDRKLLAESGSAEAELRLSTAEIEQTKFETDTRVELDREITAREREVEEVAANLSMGSGVLDALRSGSGSRAVTDSTLTFEIVRQTPRGPETIAAEGTTALRPGDLVRLRSGREGATSSRPGVAR